MKKILVIGSYANSLIHFRLKLMQAFQAKGHHVIACAPDDIEVANKLKNLNIEFVPLRLQRTGLNPFKDLVYLKDLNRLIKDKKPDVIFSYTIKPVVYGSLIGRINKIPHIYSMITGMGYIFSASNFKSKLVGLIGQNLFKLSLRFNHRVFFQNPDNLEEFVTRKLVKKPQTALINGSGIDLNHYTPTVIEERPVFLMIARLLIDKGVREFFQAAKIVKQRYPHASFLLVGWLDKNPNAISEEELQNYTRSGIIEYLGELADVRPTIAQSSVYVLPSYCEGTPRTVLEAMAMARPIITTDVPGCRETVRHGVNGYLVPAKNVDVLAQTICKFIEEPHLIKKMGEVSRHIAVEKYDVHKVNSMMLEHMNI